VVLVDRLRPLEIGAGVVDELLEHVAAVVIEPDHQGVVDPRSAP